ncbi:aldolase [Bordetella ansorpii]|uniref:Aldolase n=1 Tax=Bordetella ansorpii TaxID=288768 RepID=A0A157R8L3_9BORD|nr:aldolase [Bordetella ansorpii]SAI54330.1 aldolase [Bordetella ansorpii]
MTDTMTLSKDQLVKQAQRDMEQKLAGGNWSLRQKLALTCRILYDGGHDSGLAGQITARTGEPGTFYTQQLGMGFDEITASNLLKVDEHLNVLEGERMANPANRFHSWIYRARPDVQCIIHTHPLHAAALSMLEVPLEISHMDNCVLYGDVAFLKDWPGVPVGNEEGEIISAALQDKRAILLTHHGMLVATESVEMSCQMALQFERAARMQLLAMSAGTIRPIPPELGKEAHDWILTPKRSEVGFAYNARKALRNHPDVLG